MIANPTLSASAEGPRSDFARDIEQCGLVLARVQCGRADRARAAVDAGMRALADPDRVIDATQRLLLFWRSLLVQPALRADLAEDPANPFSQLSAGPRAALLLRLVAELDPLQAADVLAVSPATYRNALDRALEALQAKGLEAAALQYVRDRRTIAAAPLRATSPVVGPPPATAATGFVDTARRYRPALKAAVGTLLLVLVVSFFWVPAFLRHERVSRSGFQSLRADAPAATLSEIQSAVSGDDFDLLADPQGAGIARDLDLYAWYAAGSNMPAQTATAPAALPEATVPGTSATEPDAEEPTQGASSSTDSSAPAAPRDPAPAKAASAKGDHAH